MLKTFYRASFMGFICTGAQYILLDPKMQQKIRPMLYAMGFIFSSLVEMLMARNRQPGK